MLKRCVFNGDSKDNNFEQLWYSAFVERSSGDLCWPPTN